LILCRCNLVGRRDREACWFVTGHLAASSPWLFQPVVLHARFVLIGLLVGTTKALLVQLHFQLSDAGPVPHMLTQVFQAFWSHAKPTPCFGVYDESGCWHKVWTLHKDPRRSRFGPLLAILEAKALEFIVWPSRAFERAEVVLKLSAVGCLFPGWEKAVHLTRGVGGYGGDDVMFCIP